MENKINYLALALSTLIPMVIGFIYYHPKVAGTAWMQANGFTQESLGKGPKPIMFLIALILSFLLSMFVSFNVTGPGQEVDANGHSFVTFQHGVFHGVILSVVFVAPILGTMGIFEKKSMKWFLVNEGYWLITLCLMGGILSAWR
ncbi:MAG: DUF1761 domain-containing protein [Saprospiraceae bacterium]|nr:DUF1761 domain-containing protein [Saprospiraceae bacterium]